MKLNKPKVTDNQSELESYVESLLKDNTNVIVTVDSKVTPLRSKKAAASELVADNKIIKSENSPLLPNREGLSTVSLKAEVAKEKTTDRLDSQSGLSESKHIKSPLPADSQPVKAAYANRAKETIKSKEQSQSAENESMINSRVEQTKQQGITQSKLLKQQGGSEQSDTAKQHHEKINKEFTAYQESVHTNIPEQDPRLKNVEKLLSRIALASAVVPSNQNQLESASKPEVNIQVEAELENQDSQAVSAEVAEASFLHRDAKPMKELLGEVFQTLVFEVHKLPLAVPLVKLGGIVNFSEEKVTPLVGTPDWFMGLVPNERGNLMVVDTQKFLMPEKAPKEPSEYQYLIVLDNSNWALACHAVNDAKNLSPDDIRWSARSSKRPWFAGMVVEYMSALVEVDELINLLAENVVE